MALLMASSLLRYSNIGLLLEYHWKEHALVFNIP